MKFNELDSTVREKITLDYLTGWLETHPNEPLSAKELLDTLDNEVDEYTPNGNLMAFDNWCVVCGKGISELEKTCSVECWNDNYDRQESEAYIREVTGHSKCLTCGEEFSHFAGQDVAYCSEECNPSLSGSADEDCE